jgi:hypothetical protein
MLWRATTACVQHHSLLLQHCRELGSKNLEQVGLLQGWNTEDQSLPGRVSVW